MFADVDLKRKKGNKILFSRDSQCLQRLIGLIEKQDHRTLVMWAKAIDDAEYAALAHAIGHAGATVHVETHAIGLVIYELTAIVLKYDKDEYHKPVIDKIDYYYQKLLYWQENTDKLRSEWAGFLAVDARRKPY